jgi:hypothetical protein
MDYTPGIFEMDLGPVTGGNNNSKVNATNPQAYIITKKQVTAADILSLDMARGGGFAISFE